MLDTVGISGRCRDSGIWAISGKDSNGGDLGRRFCLCRISRNQCKIERRATPMATGLSAAWA